jgi:flagellar operon protein
MEQFSGRISIEQAADRLQENQKKRVTGSNTNQTSFQQILEQTRLECVTPTNSTEELRFSKHADERLAQRSISLTAEQMQRLNEGADKAGRKGIRESLVILDNLSFIVNTKNKTVITAMDQNYEDDNIYTNIDGAVII